MTIYKIYHCPSGAEYYTNFKPNIISAKYIVFINGGDASALADKNIEITKIKVISKKKTGKTKKTK